MAGGMGRKGERVSLHERIHGTPAPEQPAAPVVKHCWVTDRHGRLPGLLLEWRHTASGWQGRVVRPALEERLVHRGVPRRLGEDGVHAHSWSRPPLSYGTSRAVGAGPRPRPPRGLEPLVVTVTPIATFLADLYR